MRTILIEKRKRKKLTQAQVAEKLNISRSVYCAYELGTVSPPLEIALKIKELLNYKKDDIFFNSECPTDGQALDDS